jgi:hypothetical protein
MGLQARYRFAGGYLVTSGPLKAEARMGTGGEPGGDCRFDDGTGAGQANQLFAPDFTIAAGATQLYDLKGGSGELDVLNVALALVAVKLVLIELDTPAAGTSIRFGPQNATNAAALWFGGVTATFYDTIRSKLLQADEVTGWTIGASTKVIALHNPGAASVSGSLRVIGVK